MGDRGLSTAKSSGILMLLENYAYPQDGRVRRESTALVKAGYRVIVIAPASGNQTWRETVDGVQVLRYPAPAEAQSIWGYAWEYGYALVASMILSVYAAFRYGFNVVHAHNPPDLFVLIGMFYKVFGKRFVFDHHDLSPEMYSARFGGQPSRLTYRILTFFERLSCRWADQVIVTNDSYRKMDQERSRVPADRIAVVRNGPEPERIRRVAPNPSIRNQAPFVIGYVGTLGVQDGVDYLLRSLALLQSQFNLEDFHCTIIGSGTALPDLIKLTAELGLTNHVSFPGFLSGSALLEHMSAADIFVTPDPSNEYNDRSTMIKMMEYMALERPIVAFDLPEHRVSAGDAAVYATPNDEREFAAQIVALKNDPALRARMGAIGRQRVDEQLAWPFQAKTLISVYARLLRPQTHRATDLVASSVDSELPVQVG